MLLAGTGMRGQDIDRSGESLQRELDSLRKLLEKQRLEISICTEVERSLRESEEKYRFLVENSKDIIWKVDLQSRWTFVSSNVEKVMSYKPEEVIGKTIWDFIAPDYFRMVKEKMEQRIRGEEIPPYELEIIHKDGHYVPFEVLTAPIVDNDGKLVGIQGISRDISYRKQADAKLKQYYAELEERVEQRTAELDKARSTLQAMLDELRDSKEQTELYLDLISHDINNMNHIAMGYLEMAIDTVRQSGRLEADKLQLLEKPFDTMDDSSKLIDTVRKIQRIREGGLKLEVVRMGELLEEIKRIFSHIPGREVTVNFERKGDYPVMANPLLKDVFGNIGGNAIKHSRGPLTVSILADLKVQDGKKYYVVSIEDNGPGIDDEAKAVLRSGKKLGRKGLGLYLVRTFVKQFGGKFWIEDRVRGDYARGAKFVVMLPAAT